MGQVMRTPHRRTTGPTFWWLALLTALIALLGIGTCVTM